MNAKRHVSRLLELENDVRYQEISSESEPEYRYITGKSPVLISAPHGAVHTRNGSSKEEDEYTAGFAQLLGEITNAHVLYSRRKTATDPNADPQAPYKKYLAGLIVDNGIRFVMDLHGASEKRSFGVAIGTLYGKSCKEERQDIISGFERHGFSEVQTGLCRIDVDNELPAVGNEKRVPITRFCYELGIPAVQIELNALLRIPQRRDDATNSKVPFEGNVELIEKTVMALAEIVAMLETKYS